MKIKKVITGSLEENCYILINNNDCLVVDPGDDISLIIDAIKDYNLLDTIELENSKVVDKLWK